MTDPIFVRRRLLKSALLGIGAVFGSGRIENVHGAAQKPITASCSMMSSGVEEIPLWREIPDYPDGRLIPRFLIEISKCDGGLLPAKALDSFTLD